MNTLNTEQLLAVNEPKKSVFVLAGAGCGKTKVLVSRLAKHIREGVEPENLLAVTFTNKAAAEIKHRLAVELDQSVEGIWIGTFHSIAYKMLAVNPIAAGLKPKFTLVDAGEQFRMVRDILKNGKYPSEVNNIRDCVNYINNQKDKCIRSEGKDFLVTEYAYTKYEQQCKAENLVDFGELMLRSYELLCTESYQKHYSGKFKYVLVDEFQDTNELQYKWLKQITHANQNLFIVGDDDQSIYGWRGAKIDNIWDFQKEYDHSVIKLEQNYRCTPNILAAANNVIKNNTKRMNKVLWTGNEKGKEVLRHVANNPSNEAHYVVDKISSLLAHGTKLDEIAVLYRTHAQSHIVVELLKHRKIAHHVRGSYNFFNRAEIKLIFSYLMLIDGNEQELSYCINTPSRKIGQATQKKISTIANAENITQMEAAKQIKNKAVQNFVGEIEEFKKITSVTELIDAIVTKYQLVAHFSKDDDSVYEEANQIDDSEYEVVEKHENIQEFIDMAEGRSDLSQFVADIALSSSEFGAKKGVQLSSIHGVKGLEYGHVFVIGCENQVFPSWGAKTPVLQEEERRLMYVAMTRAKYELHLVNSLTRERFGSMQNSEPSVYLTEMLK